MVSISNLPTVYNSRDTHILVNKYNIKLSAFIIKLRVSSSQSKAVCSNISKGRAGHDQILATYWPKEEKVSCYKIRSLCERSTLNALQQNTLPSVFNCSTCHFRYLSLSSCISGVNKYRELSVM